MKLMEEKKLRRSIEDVLRPLGATYRYRGYFQAVYAIALVWEDENRLDMVTGEIYCRVAARFQCDWRAVERNIYSIVRRAWKINRSMFLGIAGSPLTSRPVHPASWKSLRTISSTARRRSLMLYETGRPQVGKPLAVV